MSVATASPPAALGPERTAFTLSALAAVFWGTNFEATRIILQGLPPWTAASARFLCAVLAIMAWMWLTEGSGLRALRRNALAYVALGLIGVAGFNAALFLGMRTSSPVTAALIMGTTPLTTNLIDALIGRRRPALIVVVGMGISLVGVALTVGAFGGARFASGDLLILGGSLAWSLYTIGCRRWVLDASPLATSAWTMLFGTLAMTVAAWVFEAPLAAASAAPVQAWAAMLWMSLFGSVLAYIFWQQGIAVRGPGPTSVLFNLVPVAALVVAALFGRAPEASQVAGVAVAILGVLLASGRIPVRRRARHQGDAPLRRDLR